MKQTRKSRLKSWKVTFRQGDAILRVYVHAINEATAKRKVEKQVPSCQVISTRHGVPQDRDWEAKVLTEPSSE